jgi:hypothetical protein
MYVLSLIPVNFSNVFLAVTDQRLLGLREFEALSAIIFAGFEDRFR